MAVTEKGQIFTCDVCGNEVIVTKVGGGSLVCCGKDMKLAVRVGEEETDDDENEEEKGEGEE